MKKGRERGWREGGEKGRGGRERERCRLQQVVESFADLKRGGSEVATTISITTFSKMTLSKTPLNITTLNTTTFSIRKISKNAIGHNDN